MKLYYTNTASPSSFQGKVAVFPSRSALILNFSATRASVHGVNLISQRHSSRAGSANSCMRVLYTSVTFPQEESFGGLRSSTPGS